jgi:hypothetical protein
MQRSLTISKTAWAIFMRWVTIMEAWAMYYRDHPNKLKTKDWEKVNDDPNWIWPNPSKGKSYNKELEDMINVEAALGLGTGLKCEHGKSSAPEGSQELECFLKQVEEEIIDQRECKFI